MALDLRNMATGHKISCEKYADQPYIVQCDDGAWLCVVTTGDGEEGSGSQHVISARSTDHGKTWSEPVAIEPAGPPESSWAMPLIVPGGRVYVFYLHNTDNLREVKADNAYARKRVDTLGHYAFKYSDDGGKTWSAERIEIPMRRMKIDRDNPYKGEVLFFWGVGKPIIHKDKAFIGMSKVGKFGEGFLAISEGFFLCSDNILTEKDPKKIRWETLPKGDEGLKAPKGPISEEHNLASLSDGSLCCINRTTEGHPCVRYSQDEGASWTEVQYARYADGRLIKHPRAACFVRRFSNGKYLLWCHNHGGKSYEDRNPAWLCGGIEKDGAILWSQPEIAIYDDNSKTRMSYPDFIEEKGRYFVTETQKSIARVHELDAAMLEELWNQFDNKKVADKGLVLDLSPEQCADKNEHAMPRLPKLNDGGGFSIDLSFRIEDVSNATHIVDAQDADGKGFHLSITKNATLQLVLSDGQHSFTWESDAGMLKANTTHHASVIVDGGPKIVTIVIDGVLCDGGDKRQFGWGRFDKAMLDINGAPQIRWRKDAMRRLRVYDRYLRTSEAIGNWRSDL